jgi:DnaJ-class molecular chaperone
MSRVCPSCNGTGVEGIDRGAKRPAPCWSCEGVGEMSEEDYEERMLREDDGDNAWFHDMDMGDQ